MIAKALLDADPSLGDSVKDVRDLLKTQFPPTTKDITDDEMFDVMDDVLRLQSTTTGKLPLTLVVLDEMQQYIGDDNEKALAVQNIVEGCSARFESQVLFVATGQSALTATPTLQKLTDRFARPGRAVRQGRRDRRARGRAAQEARARSRRSRRRSTPSSGEIDQAPRRHAARPQGGGQARPRARLPAAADPAALLGAGAPRDRPRRQGRACSGPSSRIVHEAARPGRRRDPSATSSVPTSSTRSSRPDMLQSGVLLKEIDELIRAPADRGRRRRAQVAHLRAHLPHLPDPQPRASAARRGLRATAPFLADLLVEDLADDGAGLRKRVPELLDALVADGRLMRIDDEYRLQTEEGAEWEKDYRSRLAAIRDDATPNEPAPQRAAHRRASTPRSAGSSSPTVPARRRARSTSTGARTSRALGEGDVPVWIRDEWSVTESAVKKAAAEAGDESPIVFVLPAEARGRPDQGHARQLRRRRGHAPPTRRPRPTRARPPSGR